MICCQAILVSCKDEKRTGRLKGTDFNNKLQKLVQTKTPRGRKKQSIQSAILDQINRLKDSPTYRRIELL